MRVYILIIICSVTFMFGQDYSTNRFSEEENNFEKEKKAESSLELQALESPGNPSELPVDDYIPLLILTAVGGIIYFQSRRKILK